ncbi:hypothetical protein SAMN04487996_11779 [Dyadobacter soli]|uniref:Uncharacterized protein n=1 Tax=Dyadobacter soli TaxID=659014 RepID=A0A1G7T5J4_9BACT|nr:hypothetical protein SAMN04487996_11779 [Dyadobacter soli]
MLRSLRNVSIFTIGYIDLNERYFEVHASNHNITLGQDCLIMVVGIPALIQSG